ncbi:1884_t:CDS:2 [Paraglomus occultum]|uniref:1884_t:CDS:1 n=1 Tax=Paraglomus occultum TaxID=144539 RepID=A0A9N9A3U8_9GLOM|nr:1884_t:CDS:2 [Paraglomus occultum]
MSIISPKYKLQVENARVMAYYYAGQKRKGDAEFGRPTKKYRCNISTEGPIRPGASTLVLPFLERNIFTQVIDGLCDEWKSFIIHGPYQSGKTTFLLALERVLKNSNIEPIYFEMTGAKGSINKYGYADGFTRFISNIIFEKTLAEEELYSQIMKMEKRLILLADELQYIFTSGGLLSVVKTFFKNITSRSNISYVAAGTFKLIDLMDNTTYGPPMENECLESPFNRAKFCRIPFFNVQEMDKIFNLYNDKVDPDPDPLDIKLNIIHESCGHPASFMILLKIYNDIDIRPATLLDWKVVIKQNLIEYTNGTHKKIKKYLISMSDDQKQCVRSLTNNGIDTWTADLALLDHLEKDLLNLGSSCLSTSKVFESDLVSAENLLKYGLQNIYPPTVAHEWVQNKEGPAEASFQAALYSVFNGLLPMSMMCLFEINAHGKKKLDLLVVKDSERLEKWAGYELKVKKISESDFKEPLKQAKKYADYFKMDIHLVNFYPENVHPVFPTIARVPVLNVACNTNCTEFTIRSPKEDEGIKEKQKNQPILTNYYSITGTSDIAIIDKSFLVSLWSVGGLKVVFELKKKLIRQNVYQAILETILANALSAYAVLVVLTDLKNIWHFFWLQEFEITEIVVYDILEAITIIECAVATEETQGPNTKAPPFDVSNYGNLIE